MVHDGVFAIGDDRYDVGREVAQGTMGRVMRAVDRRLDRQVAVKQMIGDSPQLVARFAREARVIGRLQHPNIIPIYDIGTSVDGRPFYSMKLVEGTTLQAAIETTPAEDRASLLPAVLAVVDAIAFAHKQRIIHRDLKPLNVLVGSFGETLVIDWGLAKDLDEPEDQPVDADAPPTEGHTRLGQVLGTPAYMPPEQARGEPLDQRCDVYALGAILYHVLAGEPPYAGGDPKQIVAEVLERPATPLSELRRDLPIDLLAIVEKAMARRKQDRYPTAQELAADLRRLQTGQLVGAHRYTMGQRFGRFVRRHRAAVTAAVMVVVATVIIGALSIIQVLDERDRARAAEASASRDRDGAEELTRFMMTDLRARLQPLGKLSLMDSIAEKVDEYYRELFVRDGGFQPKRRADALQMRGDVARYRGDSRSALDLYRDAAALGLLYPSAETSRAWLSVGEVLLEQGDLDGAERNFLIAQQLGGFSGQTHLRLGMVAEARGESRAAIDHWRAAAADLEQLARERPAQLDVLHNIVVAHGMAADLLWKMEQIDEARAELARSGAAAERLLAAEPDEPRWLRATSLVSDRLGELEASTNNLEAADRAFRAGLAIAERLAAQDPSNQIWQSDLAVSLRNVAGIANMRARPADALPLLERALPIADRAAANDPSSVEDGRVQSSMHLELARVLASLGRRADATTELRRTVELRRAELARSQDNAMIEHDLATALHELAMQLAEPAAALEVLGEAKARLDRLVQVDDAVSERRQTLAEVELAIARLQLLRPKGPLASREHAARALTLFERLDREGAIPAGSQSHLAEARELARTK